MLSSIGNVVFIYSSFLFYYFGCRYLSTFTIKIPEMGDHFYWQPFIGFNNCIINIEEIYTKKHSLRSIIVPSLFEARFSSVCTILSQSIIWHSTNWHVFQIHSPKMNRTLFVGLVIHVLEFGMLMGRKRNSSSLILILILISNRVACVQCTHSYILNNPKYLRRNKPCFWKSAYRCCVIIFILVFLVDLEHLNIQFNFWIRATIIQCSSNVRTLQITLSLASRI